MQERRALRGGEIRGGKNFRRKTELKSEELLEKKSRTKRYEGKKRRAENFKSRRIPKRKEL